MGCFPRVVHWDGDGKKDLLIGEAGGKIKLFLNVDSDDAPSFDGGTYLQVGPSGSKVDMDVGFRAALTIVDWNNDEKKDLVVGAYDAKIHIFINQGTDVSPDFLSETIAQADGEDLIVPDLRASPAVLDWDGDGKKDLLAGNTAGWLLFYDNVNTDQDPSFSTYSLLEADGVPIDLPGSARSRIFTCKWSHDWGWDVLIGGSDGKVRLYQAVLDDPIPTLSEWGILLFCLLMVGAASWIIRKKAAQA